MSRWTVRATCGLCSSSVAACTDSDPEVARAKADELATEAGFVRVGDVKEPDRYRFAQHVCAPCAADVAAASVKAEAGVA